MKLDETSVAWAITSLNRHGDTDLFPKPFEIKILCSNLEKCVRAITALDISNYQVGAPRRFVVPKDNVSCRAATQLDPLDSVILTALIHQFGNEIEKRRVPSSEGVVFSYRFQPSEDGDLYQSRKAWNKFWEECKSRITNKGYAVILDISDFYNQVSHHTIENQMVESGLPNQVIQWIKRLLQVESSKVSRGIPVGPHSAHILAEAALIPLDNSLRARGIEYCRYVDDIILFVDERITAQKYVYEVAEMLDKQQRLQLQRQKTDILDAQAFLEYCSQMIKDRPINDFEVELLDIIEKYSEGDPYRVIYLSEINEEDLKAFRQDVLEEILSDYLKKKEPDFVRLRWFLRRLSQVGHPGVLKFCLENFCSMSPAVAELCQYFISVGASGDEIDWPDIGSELIELLDNPIIQSSEYFQLSVLSLFNRNIHLNQVPKLLSRYKNASPFLRREIIVLAAESSQADWVRELKQEVPCMDPWTKRAFLYASSKLPSEERKFFLKSVSSSTPMEQFIIDWAK